MSVDIEQDFDFFLGNQFQQYKEGEWVAIYEKKVVSHGLDLKKVISEAKKVAPMSKVLLSKVKKTATYL